MKEAIEPAMEEMNPRLPGMVESACKRIPPLWTLKNFVAVNPFVGLSDRHFIDTARLMQRVGHGDMLMPAEFYRQQIESGRIQESDFHAALKLVVKIVPARWARQVDHFDFHSLKSALSTATPQPASTRVLTFSDYLDEHGKGGWSAFIVEEISKWCSAYYDQGQSSWRMPWRHSSLLAAWKAAAELDANPELSGLNDFRAFVSTLPSDHLELIDRMLAELGVPDAIQADFLHRQLMSLPGWSGYVQYRVRENNMAGMKDDSLAQFLAIRLVYDVALLHRFGADARLQEGWAKHLTELETASDDVSAELLARYVAQEALEYGYQRALITKLNTQPSAPASGPRTLQAVFCIDVRSEVYRRSLEAQSNEIQTLGFAGFFGMAIEYLKFGRTSGGAQCPVLLSPKIKVREVLHHAQEGEANRLLSKMSHQQAVHRAWNAFKTSAISCFSFVETAGLWFGVKLVKDSIGLDASESTFAANGGRRQFGPTIKHENCCTGNNGHAGETGIALADQISLAAGALKNMGLTSNFAKVVLICGHGSATRNNPYGSALDCGACGGHAGDANARVAAAILNQPAVREGLHQRGIQIPAETVFIPGLHNTTTDEILIYDVDNLSANQAVALEKIKGWLDNASRNARRERAPALGLASPESESHRQIFQRSRDWSQVRPEWGLAGNASFIAAPRARTQGRNLGGRTFLHDYRSSLDPDKSTLELIMVAPMVVASWINLQYYGSTVNNRLFGSGNKVLHNVVGTFGVWQGNGGDLQPGLPLQSVHDGTKWMHEPLRLNVFIEADPGVIEGVLSRQPGVRELVENRWVNLFALEPSGPRIWRYGQTKFVEESQ